MGRIILILGAIALGFLIYKIVYRIIGGKNEKGKTSNEVRSKYKTLIDYFSQPEDNEKITDTKNGIKISRFSNRNSTIISISQEGTSVHIEWFYKYNIDKKLRLDWTFHQTRDQNDIVKIISADINNSFRAKEH